MKRENKNALSHSLHVCDRRNSFVVILLKAAVKYVFLI